MGNQQQGGAQNTSQDEKWLKVTAGGLYEIQDELLPAFDRTVDNKVFGDKGGTTTAGWHVDRTVSGSGAEPWGVDMQALAAVLTIRSNADQYLEGATADVSAQLRSVGLLLPHEHLSTAVKITASDKSSQATEVQRIIRSRAVLRLHLAITRHTTSASAVQRSSKLASAGALSAGQILVEGVEGVFSRRPSPGQHSAVSSSSSSLVVDKVPTLSDLLFATSISVSASTLRGLIETHSGTPVIVSHAFLSLVSVLETMLPHMAPLPRSPHFAQVLVEAAASTLETEAENEQKALMAWDRARSNPNLEFNEDSTTARRPGNASSYPAALVTPSFEEICTLTMVLTEATQNNNWLTIGIAYATFPHASSDGFGRQINSWGLQDDRSSASDSSLQACGTKEATFRKLRLGDVVSLVADLKAGYCDVIVNAGELRHRFILPADRRPESYVMGATFANDHKLRIIPLPYSLVEVLSKAETYTAANTRSVRQVRCPNNHVMSASHGLPPSEEAGGGVIIACNKCARSNIHLDKVCIFNCEQCPLSYDLCLACSISASNVSRRNKVALAAAASSAGLLHNPLATLSDEGPAAVALEQLLDLGRLALDQASSSSADGPPTPPTPPIVRPLSANPYAQRSPRRAETEALAETQGSHSNVAISVMFAVAVLRQSLSGLLEVLYLLHESPRDRFILPCAERFASYLLGGAGGEGIATVSLDVFFGRHQQASSSGSISSFEASSIRQCDLTLAGSSASYFGLRELSLGEKQAIAILNALGEVASGSSSAFFPIAADSELDELIGMIEKGSAALVQDSFRSGGGGAAADDADAKMAFVGVAFCSAALRIVYNNLCRLFAPGKGVEGSAGSSPLDVCHPANLSTYRHRLRSALRQITEAACVDPVNSAIGKFAVSFSAFHHLTPKASEQFQTVRELLEKMETGQATLCEQEVLLLHMSNLQGPKLLELVSSSTAAAAAAEGQHADDEDVSAGANFLTSLLMLADRSLRTKCVWVRQRLSLSLGPGESKDEEALCESKEDLPPAEVQGVLQEVILKVLEPIAMQVVSMLMSKVLEELGPSAGGGPQAEGSSPQVKKLNALMLAFLHSAHAAVQNLCSLQAERGHDLLFAALSDEIGKSHVGSLLPLSMFTLHLFLDELLAKPSTASAASGFAELIAPLTALADSIRAVNSKRHGGRLSPGRGKQSISDVDVPATSHWDKALSDSHLVCNVDATTCSYPEGNISNEQIYENEHADLARSPAAFILVPDEYSSCSVVIEAVGYGTYSQLSVGMCRVGMPTQMSGFGLSADTWGIVNPRDDSEPAYFAVSGQMVGAAPRKLNAEDTVTIVSDLRTGLLRFLVKSKGSSPEFSYAFDSSRTGPRGSKSDFLYGATFATDHHLRVQANLQCLLRSQEMGSIVRACLEAGEKSPSSSWLARLKSEVQELQVIIVRQHLEVEGREGAGTEAAVESLRSCCDWLDSPLLTQGKILLDPSSPGGPTSPDASAPALKLLRELTDAPDGLGDAQRLVALMKKYVLQDRGTVAGPSHIAHAACAAAIWHKGYSDEVYEILQASLAGESVKPSEGLKRLWRQGQSMRKVFELEPEDDGTSSTSSLLQSPATSPPMSPVPFVTPEGGDEEEFSDVEPVPKAPIMNKQFSLPPLQQGQEPLNPAVLGAVRRARLLLSFQPVSLVCAPGDPALLMEKTNDAAKSLYNFIASGPDPDEMRELVSTRTETAQRRCRGLSLVLDLCRRSGIAEDAQEGTALLRRVALSLHCLAAKSRAGDASKGGKDARASDLPRDEAEADGEGTRVHYLLHLQGSPRASQVAVRAAWFKLVAEFIKAGNHWMDDLEGHDEGDAAASEIASAVLAIFAAITIDYDHVWDIEPISASGMVEFILRSMGCSDAAVRDAALVLYESVIFECCRGVDYFAKIENAERASAANAVLSVLLYQGSGCLRSARSTNLIHNISSSPSLGPRPAKTPTIALESGSVKIFGYRLLDGCLLCDRAEEGSLLFLAPSPEEPADTAKDSKYLKGYSLTSWIFRKADAPTGVLLRRGLPPLQNSDFSISSAHKTPISFAWSSLTVALLPGGQLSVSIADPLPDNRDQVFIIATPVVRTEVWAFFGFSIDFLAATISLYLDNAVVATKKLSATLIEGAKGQNACNAAALPFRSIFGAPGSSAPPPSTEPFCCGQMIHSHPLNAASCLLANVSLFAMPLSSGAFEAVVVETLPRTLRPSADLVFGLTSRGVTCQNRSPDSRSVYACVAGDGSEAQLRLQFDDAVWSAESRLSAAVILSDGSLGDVHSFGTPIISSPTAVVALYLDQHRGLLLSCAECPEAAEAEGASLDIIESTFEVGEKEDRVAFCITLAPGQRVTLLRADVDSSRLDQVDGWPKLQTACTDPREQPAAVPQLTMFNAGWSLDAPASLSMRSHCHRSHVIKLLAAFVRVGKALVVLSRCDGACFDDYFCGPCGVFESFFSLAFDGASSTLRLAATRALCVFVSLLKPEYVDSVLRDLGHLVCPDGAPGLDRPSSSFVLAAVRSLGCVANPHGSLETLHAHGPYLCVSTINRAMLVFQLREVLAAVASSPQSAWRGHLIATVSEIVGQSGRALEYLRTNQLPFADALDWLIGLLSAGSSDVLPGQSLYPGSRVLHKGVGSSIAEDFTVLAHGTKGSFGEQMYVAPTQLFHCASQSERPSCASSGQAFECVFTSVLQTCVLPQSDTPLVSILAFPHNDAPCDGEREGLFVLLQEAVVVDTTDPRPMPPYPRREDGSRGLAIVQERRELMFESLHNYRDNTDELREISIPGASELVITFDPQSRTELNYDYVKFFKDSKKAAYWGAEKYSGTTWPGVNGVDPLVIPADSCFLYFKSDGNNNDWGYRFTVVGLVPTKVPRILRPPSCALLLSRLVRIMAVDVVVKLLTSSAVARQGEAELEAGGQAAKSQAAIAEFFGPRLWRAVLGSLTTSSLSRALADFDGTDFDREAAQTRLEVSLSSVPAQTDMKLATLLTMLLNNRCLVDPLRRDAFFGPSVASSPELFQSVVNGFQYKPSEPSVWAHEGSLDSAPLSEDLVAQMAMDGLAPMHVPSERCEVAALETSERALTMSMDEDAVPLPFPQIRLECMPGTTHCRIRAGPSMQTAEVGDFVSGSIAAVTSEVDGFYRLADDRGFVKAYVDRAVDWHRVLPPACPGISYADQSSKYAKGAKRFELQVADYWESCLLQALEGVVARSAYCLLCTTLNQWPRDVAFTPDDGEAHLLLKATGLGIVTFPKNAAKKKRQTLYSKKRQVGGLFPGQLASTPLLTSFYHLLAKQSVAPRDGPETHLCPLALSLMSIAAGTLQRTHATRSQRQVVLPATPDPQTLLSPVVLESLHEYENNTDSMMRIHIAGAKGLEIIFDDESSTERNYDAVTIYADETRQTQLGGKYSGKRSSSERNFPGVGDQPSLIVENRNEVWVHFVTDGTNVDWGWRLTAYPLVYCDGQDAESASSGDVNFCVRRDFGAKKESAEISVSLSSGQLLFNASDTPPSLALGVAILDAVLGGAGAGANRHLPGYLFASAQGCTLLDALLRCVEHVNQEHALTAKTFFEVVIFVLGSYQAHCEAEVGRERERESDVDARTRLRVRALLSRLAARVVALAEPAIAACSAQGRAVRFPSPFMQALSQAAIVCHHSGLGAICAATDNDKAVLKEEGGLAEGKVAAGVMGKGGKGAIDEPRSPESLCHAPQLALTHGGFGVRFSDAVPLPAGQCAIAWGPTFSDLSFPCRAEAESSATTSNIDPGPRGQYEHTCYVAVVSEGPPGTRVSIGLSLLSARASVADGSRFVGDHAAMPGSIAWEAHSDAEGRRVGGVRHAAVDSAAAVKEVAKFDNMERGFRKGDLVGVTLIVRNGQTQGQEQDGTPAAGEDDAQARSSSVGSEWSVEFTLNGAAKGSFSSTRPVPFLNLAAPSDDHLESTFAISVGLSAPGAEVVFVDALDVPFVARRPSSAVPPPFIDLAGTASQQTNYNYQGKVITAWAPSISDPDLIFSDGATMSRRPGSSSCYPASMVHVDEARVSLTCTLVDCPIGPNSMSFGIAKAGFKKTGSDGFGPSVNSWGIIESRSSGDGKVYSNRSVVTTFRKMKAGDRFCLRYERAVGKAWLFVDGAGRDFSAPELVQEFDLHRPDEIIPLVIGATFCNDHSLLVMDCPPPALPHIDARPADFKGGLLGAAGGRAGLSAGASASAAAAPGPGGQTSPTRSAAEPGGHMSARAQECGLSPLALQSPEQAQARYLELDAALSAMCPPSALEQVRAVHCRHADTAPPRALPSNLKSLWTVYGLLLLLAKTETHDREVREARRGGEEEDRARALARLIPAPLVFDLLTPLCMAASTQLVRADCRSSPEGHRQTIRVPGAIAYAIQVLPSSSLGPRGLLALSAASPGSHYSASFRGAQPPRKHGAEAAPSVGAMAELLRAFCEAREPLLLAGPAQLDAASGPASRSYRFAAGDVVTRPAGLGGDGSSGGELGDVESVEDASAADDAAEAVPEEASDGSPTASDASSPAERTKADVRGQVLHVRWRGRPEELERVVLLRGEASDAEGEGTSAGQGGQAAASPESTPRTSAPRPAVEPGAAADLRLWQQGYWSGQSGRGRGALAEGCRVLWSPVHAESVDVSILWDDSPNCPQSLSIAVTPLFALETILHDAAFADLRRAVATYPHTDPRPPPTTAPSPAADDADLDRACRHDSAVDHSLMQLMEKKHRDKAQSWTGMLSDKWAAFAPSAAAALAQSPALVELLAREQSLPPDALLRAVRPGVASVWGLGVPVSEAAAPVDAAPVAAGGADATLSAPDAPSAGEDEEMPALDPRQSLFLSARVAVIQTFNAELVRCIDLIDFSTLAAHGLGGAARTIGTLLRNARSLVFSSVKSPIVEGAITKSEIQNVTRFELLISRPRAARFATRGECDVDGRWSVFGQVFRALHGMAPSTFRKTTALWDTVFAGERAQDAGGPYRESWSALTQELSSPHTLPLLRLCPNGRHSVGTFRDTLVLNPDAATSRTCLDMLSFLGKLFGIAARSKSYLDLSLSPLVWKLLVKEVVSAEDLWCIDYLSMTWLESLRRKRALGDSDLDSDGEATFTATSLGGSLVELHPGGAGETLRMGVNDGRYIDEMVAYRLREMAPAARAIRAGLETQLPPASLALLRWDELERMVCGSPTVDIELMKSACEYASCSASDEHVVWFWEVMESDFSEEDRKAFLRFAWGRSRLPLTRAGFTQLLKIQNFTKTPCDRYLPVSHTCFFSIELPRYSSKEILRQKLAYAIHHCTAIDGDETTASRRAADLSWE